MDDDYYLFDCPGQIELYTHMKVMRRFVDILQTWNFRLCGVFLVDSHFMVDGATFLSGTMAALSGKLKKLWTKDHVFWEGDNILEKYTF